jgi:hypothetical protein
MTKPSPCTFASIAWVQYTDPRQSVIHEGAARVIRYYTQRTLVNNKKGKLLEKGLFFPTKNRILKRSAVIVLAWENNKRFACIYTAALLLTYGSQHFKFRSARDGHDLHRATIFLRPWISGDDRPGNNHITYNVVREDPRSSSFLKICRRLDYMLVYRASFRSSHTKPLVLCDGVHGPVLVDRTSLPCVTTFGVLLHVILGKVRDIQRWTVITDSYSEAQHWTIEVSSCSVL